jgi:trehalose 6-phosphate synthase
MPWTRERLEEVCRTRLGGARLVVVANREPFIHVYEADQVRCLRPASGLTTALSPVMRACGGVWVAHGSGDADRAVSDEHSRVAVPPEDPSYSLRRVWLTREEEQGYYYGFANESLWPLCHAAYVRPRFDPGDWEQYQRVNRKFAQAVLEEVEERPRRRAVVFVQDYHFALLPRLLKEARRDLVVVQFWHIPWPHREVFGICPWQEELLFGMLGNDLLAFHTQQDCNNFLETVDRGLEARLEPDRFAATCRGHTTVVRPQPISVDPDDVAANETAGEERRLRRRLRVGNRPLLVGVDRIDYIKGIPERLRAVDRLLVLHPQLRGKFHFVQVGAPSRVHIGSYRALNEELEALVEQINWKHGDESWRPIVFSHEHWGPRDIFTLYRLAAGCVVSSLHDGMNLVAKEFVAARTDEQGVLVLSQFAGAARELTEALRINPYALDEVAQAYHLALTMPAEEQRRRMCRMRQQVADNNIYRWAGMLLSEAGKLLGTMPAEPAVRPPHALNGLHAGSAESLFLGATR